MVMKYCLLAITGLSGGMLVAAGVFALITSTGVIPRMAGKSHTGRYVRTYESAVIYGGIWWNIFWIASIKIPFTGIPHDIFLALMGICQGVFIGSLAVSLAEALNTTAIFSRRIKLQTGLSFIVLSLAIGKIVGALIQFANNWAK